MKIKIISKELCKERLTESMRKKGYVHRNGKPFQLLLANESGVAQPKISAILLMTDASIKQEDLQRLAHTLEVQEQWLIGGEYIPPLFIEKKKVEQIHNPEENEPEKGKNDIVGALWGIVRQLQKLNEYIEGRISNGTV